MKFTLKDYNCSFCNNNITETLLIKQGFCIVKCKHCDFVYVNPRISNEELVSIYKHNYFKNKDYGYVGYEQEKRLRIKNFERWLNDADKYISISSIPVLSLDVGCAAGYCLEVMNKKGWNAIGIELDIEMYKNLEQSGYIISNSNIEDFNCEKKLSIITLFDVIEHIPNIDAVFKKLHSLLAKDGIIVMVTPDYQSFQRKLFGKRWFQYKPIEHIQYFDKRSLKAFAERNGLEIVHQKTCGQYADTQFLINRLNYYHFTFLAKVFYKIFGLLRLKDKFFYMDTGSLFVIFKRK